MVGPTHPRDNAIPMDTRDPRPWDPNMINPIPQESSCDPHAKLRTRRWKSRFFVYDFSDGAAKSGAHGGTQVLRCFYIWFSRSKR